MVGNVHKLVTLVKNQWTTSADLAKVVLQDYALICKVLRVVNSPPYALEQTCSSISQAVNSIGFDALRELAVAPPRFENLVKSGFDKKGLCTLWARSFLSASLACWLVDEKGLNVSSEETLLATLLHSLGKTVVCLDQADSYQTIELKIDNGQLQNEACRAVLGGVTYQEIGVSLAQAWHLPERLIAAMDKHPKPPRPGEGSGVLLTNLANFATMCVDCVGNGSDLGPVFQRYGKRLEVEANQVIVPLKKGVELVELSSDAVRYGLAKLKMRARIRALEINAGHGLLNSDPPAEQASRLAHFRSSGDEAEESAAGAGEAPEPAPQAPPSPLPAEVQECLLGLTRSLSGTFEINRFFFKLLEGLYRLLGFDRVILALCPLPPARQTLHGGFGFGEIDPADPAMIERILAGQTPSLFTTAVSQGRDMMIRADKANTFPTEFLPLVSGRHVYLFPLTLDQRGLGLIYLDRKVDKPLLDQGMIRMVRLFRDCAVKALEAIR